MHLRLTLIIAFCLTQFLSQCQSPADWWYFGNNAGIHFTVSGPVADLDGQLATFEGCSSVSSANGDLLFYTGGVNVYNKNHIQMPNGFGLLGNESSTQSSVVVPKPGSTTQYYIFTTMAAGAIGGLNYTLVDMTLDGGDGDVVVAEKNVPMHNPVAEKLTAVAKDDGFWVVSHSVLGDTFLVYEVTSSGVNTTPVISNVGGAYPYVGWGYMKFEPCGNKLASANGNMQNIEIFDFNLNTGVLSNPISWTSANATSLYGIEFSPDLTKLYVNEWVNSNIVQFDITSGNAATIQASEFLVFSGSGGGALQLGPDGKIYVARMNRTYISSIEDPDMSGAACNFNDTAVNLDGRFSQIGLPSFIQSYFCNEIRVLDRCFGDSMAFAIDTTDVDSVLWSFGDPASGSLNSSQLLFPKHLYTNTGNHTVTVIIYFNSLIDTLSLDVYIYPRQTLDLGSDTLLCEGDILELNIHQDFSTYFWHDGSTSDSILLTSDVQAFVTLFGVCDTLHDTINVRFDRPVPIDLGLDTTFCEGSSIDLDADVTVEADYQWNTGDTADHITIAQSGLYIFQAENGCGQFVDSISITVIPLPDTALLPADTINCFDAQIVLERPVNDSITFIWSDSTSKLRFEVDSTQQVWLAAFNECGFSVDTMNILFNGEIKTELGEDTNICDLDSIQLFGLDSNATYQWSTGDTTSSIWTEVGFDENYIVTIFKGECARVESRRVFSNDIFCPSIDCNLEFGNVFSPNGDGINDLFRVTSDCDVYSFDMTIYNRWGQLVNYSRNIAYGWDGFINGEPAAEGVYYFIVEYKDFVVVDADRQLTRGSFTLTR